MTALQKIADSKQSDCENQQEAATKGHADCIEALYEPGLNIEAAKIELVLRSIAESGKWELMQKLWDILQTADEQGTCTIFSLYPHTLFSRSLFPLSRPFLSLPLSLLWTFARLVLIFCLSAVVKAAEQASKNGHPRILKRLLILGNEKFKYVRCRGRSS